MLAGCASTSLKTSTVLEVESKYHVMPMVQTPTVASAHELIPVINRLFPLVMDELVSAGVVKDRESVEKSLRETRVALIEQPEACGLSKPCVGVDRCARVRGCSWAWARAAWVARRWPPIKRSEWPDEPCDHTRTVCAVDSTAQQSTDYLPDLSHELSELICQTVGADAHSPTAVEAQNRATDRYRKQVAQGRQSKGHSSRTGRRGSHEDDGHCITEDDETILVKGEPGRRWPKVLALKGRERQARRVRGIQHEVQTAPCASVCLPGVRRLDSTGYVRVSSLRQPRMRESLPPVSRYTCRQHAGHALEGPGPNSRPDKATRGVSDPNSEVDRKRRDESAQESRVRGTPERPGGGVRYPFSDSLGNSPSTHLATRGIELAELICQTVNKDSSLSLARTPEVNAAVARAVSLYRGVQ